MRLSKKILNGFLSLILAASCFNFTNVAHAEESLDSGDQIASEATQFDSHEAEILTEIATEEPSDQNLQNNEASSEVSDDVRELVAAKEIIDFIYIESSKVGLNEDENIVVALFETAPLVLSAQLHYQNKSDSSEELIDSNQISGNAILFSQSFSNEQELGEHRLLGITCVLEDASSEESQKTVYIDFTLYEDEEYSFTVVAESTLIQADDLESTGITAYSINEAGEVVAADSIDEALDLAGVVPEELEEDISISPKARSLSNYDSLLSPFSAQPTSSPKLTIMLDPGHGGSDPGAGNEDLGLEKDMNWTIASACKEKLETYYGVKVLMSRGKNDAIGSDDYKTRVDRAIQQGAQVFISFHVNAGGGTGAEVLVPSYDGTAHVQISYQLAQKVAAKLSALGLVNRGLKERDDLAVIRQSSAAGIPGILIEHGFIDDRWGDWEKWLSNDAGLTALGIADAEAIAAQFNLSTWDWSTKAWSVVSGPTFSVAIEEGANHTGSAGAPPGLESVSVAVWGEAGGQNDLTWYPLSKESQGYAIRNASLSKHGEVGTYNVHVYASVGGISRVIAISSFYVNSPSATVSLENVNDSSYEIAVSNLSSVFGVKEVLIPTWSSVNGQDDIVWYKASQQSNGTYRVKVNRSNHRFDRGQFSSHVYLVDTLNNSNYIGSKNPAFDIPKVSANYDKTTGMITVTATGDALKPVQNVAFPVWSEVDGQDDLRWYQPTRQPDGSWKSVIPFSNHKSYGKYYVHMYLSEGGFVCGYYGTSFDISPLKVNMSIENVNDAGSFDVVISGQDPFTGMESIQVPVWSQVDGQDDLVWYTPTLKNGKYRVQVNSSTHKYSRGQYYAHAYVNDLYGRSVCIGTSNANLSVPSVTATFDQSTGLATITASGAALSSATNVAFPVWSSSGGQADLRWYQPTRQANGTWVASVPFSNHRITGQYNVHIYLACGSSTLGYHGTTFSMQGGYLIMGTSNINYLQMAKYYKASSPKSFPSFYADAWTASSEKGNHAQTIEEFCAIIQEEAYREGVKAEVVFAQLLHETGWLQFQGDVKIDQFNFAGIGATGGGERGNVFPDARTGIRAQVQHLKAYASTKPLNLACVDPRFTFVQRGCAPYVEDLGGKWAAGSQYGYVLVNQQIEPMLAMK